MKFDVLIAGKTRTVELQRDADRWRISLDGNSIDADALEIAPSIFSILLNGQCHEIRIAPSPDGTLTLQTGHHEFIAELIDPRAWRGRRHGAVEVEGRQQITAPMPGKVVRLLVQPGDKVQAGQGLLVVEAMKMQNEIRSPKSGTVERLLARAGEVQHIGALAGLAAKALAKHVGDIGFVVDDKDADTHEAPRLAVCRLRGRRMVNSVNLRLGCRPRSYRHAVA